MLPREIDEILANLLSQVEESWIIAEGFRQFLMRFGKFTPEQVESIERRALADEDLGAEVRQRFSESRERLRALGFEAAALDSLGRYVKTPKKGADD